MLGEVQGHHSNFRIEPQSKKPKGSQQRGSDYLQTINSTKGQAVANVQQNSDT